MRIIGIDPGTATTGWSIIEVKDRSNMEIVDCDCVITKAGTPFDERLALIFGNIKKIITKYHPDVMAVEELFFAKNAKTAIAVGHARGVIMLAASEMKIPVYEYTPLQVKQAVVGYGRAEKGQIQAMLRVMFKNHDIPKQDDTSDAIAVAVTHAQTKRYRPSL